MGILLGKPHWTLYDCRGGGDGDGGNNNSSNNNNNNNKTPDKQNNPSFLLMSTVFGWIFTFPIILAQSTLWYCWCLLAALKKTPKNLITSWKLLFFSWTLATQWGRFVYATSCLALPRTKRDFPFLSQLLDHRRSHPALLQEEQSTPAVFTTTETSENRNRLPHTLVILDRLRVFVEPKIHNFVQSFADFVG